MKRYTSFTLLLLMAITLMQAQTKVLFIGDSITDGNWGNSCGMPKPSDERSHWDMNHIYGSGYMYLCAAHYQGNYPEREYEFFNRGISGNTLSDLQARWQKDVLEINPDVLSVLIGTNDVSQFLDQDQDDAAFDFDKWEATYRQLLSEARMQNPDLKLVICAPFVANAGNMRKSDHFMIRKAMITQCDAITKQIAKDYQAVYVPFNELFASLLQEQPTSKDTYWIWDGIHPTPAGHKRMADMWVATADLTLGAAQLQR